MKRETQTALDAAISFLSISQDPDGGWGYSPGQLSVVEPTAAAVLALGDDPANERPREKALSWLLASQREDGGWGLNAEDGESGWQTAWAVWALASSDADQDAVHRGVAWLVDVATLDLGDDEIRAKLRQLADIDPDLRGWPWLPGEASFVEPTALAMLAIHQASATRPNQARLEEAVAYLVDRRCPSGGWNVGNPVMLGKALVPRAHPTAWALLALSRLAPHTIAAEDLAALRADMEEDGGALALAWGVLTLAALGHQATSAASRLAQLQAPDGGWNANPYHTASAVLAIRGSG